MRRVTLGFCLLGVLCFAPAGESGTKKPAKVDLTDYLEGHPAVDDFRTYNRDDGPTRTRTVYQVAETKKSTIFAAREVEDGEDSGADVTEIVHGKEVRYGSIFYTSGLSLITKPKKAEPFFMAPGVPVKFKIGFKSVINGRKVGSAMLAGTTTFVGFESVETHLGTFDEVAHFHRVQTLTLKGTQVPTHVDSTSDSWVSLELGTVKAHQESQLVSNGVVTDTFGPHDYEFDHGEHDGTPYGAPQGGSSSGLRVCFVLPCPAVP
jgi:hypothetical protein